MTKKIIFISFLTCFISLCHHNSYAYESRVDTTYGYLNVFMQDLDSVYVVINDDFESVQKISSHDTLTVETGRVTLRFMNRYYVDMVRITSIKENEITNISLNMISFTGPAMSWRSSYPRVFWQANHFIITDPETALYVNGVYAGKHYSTVNTDGTFAVRGVHPSGKIFDKTFQTHNNYGFHFHQSFIKPSRRKARERSLVPGLSQFYKDQKLKGVIFSIATIGGSALAVSYELQYKNTMNEFQELNRQYNRATDPGEAFLLGFEAENKFNKASALSKTRNQFLYGAAMFYLINIIDAFVIAPATGYRDESRKINPYLDFDMNYKQPQIGIKALF